MDTMHMQNEPKKKKFPRLLLVLIPVFLLVIAAGVTAGILIPKNTRYNEAMAFLEKDKIREAVEIYGELGDYRNLFGEICRYTEDACDSLLAEGAYLEIADLYDAVKEQAALVRTVEKRLYRKVLSYFENENASGMTALYGAWTEKSALKSVVEDAFVLYARDMQVSDPPRFRQFYLSLADSAEGRALCGLFLRNTPALSSAHYEVDLAMLSYYTYLIYDNFVAAYEAYLSLFGLDPSIPLKEQNTSEGQSWYQYFMDSAVEMLKNTLICAEAAAEEKITLQEADRKEIETSIAALARRAEENGLSMEAYLSASFGPGVSEEDVRRAMTLVALSSRYEEVAFAALSEEVRAACLESLAARYSVAEARGAISWLAQ